MRVKTMDGAKNSTECLTLLSRLLLECDVNNSSGASSPARETSNEELAEIVSTFSAQDFGELWNLATSHHVIARAFPALHQALAAAGHERADWVQQALLKEHARIQRATRRRDVSRAGA